MTDSGWVPQPLPTPPPRKRSGTQTRAQTAGGWRSWVLPLLGCAPIAIVVAFTLLLLPTTVRSTSELTSVGFGWPFAWTFQDQTRYAPQHFPMTAEYVGPKGMTEPLATEIDLALFAVNSVVLWVIAGALLLATAALLKRRRATATGPKTGTAASADAGTA